MYITVFVAEWFLFESKYSLSKTIIIMYHIGCVVGPTKYDVVDC